jgi:hypothetical protein
MFVRAAEMVRRPGLFRAENDADACRSFAAVEGNNYELRIRKSSDEQATVLGESC